MLTKIKTFVKKEAVFCISALCAVITMFLVPPSAEYIDYIDFRVLCLLMCLMGVVAGFKSVGAFKWLTYQLLRRIKSGRVLGLTLVMLPFFASMLVTNDVALLVFVPFTMPSDKTPSKLFALTFLSSFSTQMLDLNSFAFCMKNVAGRA